MFSFYDFKIKKVTVTVLYSHTHSHSHSHHGKIANSCLYVEKLSVSEHVCSVALLALLLWRWVCLCLSSPPFLTFFSVIPLFLLCAHGSYVDVACFGSDVLTCCCIYMCVCICIGTGLSVCVCSFSV